MTVMQLMTPLQAFTWEWPDTAIQLGVILLVALIARWLLHVGIQRVIASSMKKAEAHGAEQGPSRLNELGSRLTGWDSGRHEQRTRTLGSLLGSIGTAVIAVIALMTMFSAVGVPLSPILASAGVGGLAIGFGAQALVKDLLSGIFMMIEDQYGVGDIITVGEITGTVEEVGLRVTRISDFTGKKWYIRNGEISTLGNLSQGWSGIFIDIPVHYSESPERVLEVLHGVVDELANDPQWSDDLIEAPQVLGVDSITGVSMTVRVLAKTHATKQWAMGRELRNRAKRALDDAGVKGPFTNLPEQP